MLFLPTRGFAQRFDKSRVRRTAGLLAPLYIRPRLVVVVLLEPGYRAVGVGIAEARIERGSLVVTGDGAVVPISFKGGGSTSHIALDVV